MESVFPGEGGREGLSMTIGYPAKSSFVVTVSVLFFLFFILFFSWERVFSSFFFPLFFFLEDRSLCAVGSELNLSCSLRFDYLE